AAGARASPAISGGTGDRTGGGAEPIWRVARRPARFRRLRGAVGHQRDRADPSAARQPQRARANDPARPLRPRRRGTIVAAGRGAAGAQRRARTPDRGTCARQAARSDREILTLSGSVLLSWVYRRRLVGGEPDARDSSSSPRTATDFAPGRPSRSGGNRDLAARRQ